MIRNIFIFLSALWLLCGCEKCKDKSDIFAETWFTFRILDRKDYRDVLRGGALPVRLYDEKNNTLFTGGAEQDGSISFQLLNAQEDQAAFSQPRQKTLYLNIGNIDQDTIKMVYELEHAGECSDKLRYLEVSFNGVAYPENENNALYSRVFLK